MPSIDPPTNALTCETIEDIDVLYKNYVNSPSDLMAYVDLMHALQKATEKVELSTEKTLVKALVHRWCQGFALRINPKVSVSTGTLKNMADVMHLILAHKFLEPMLERTHYRNMLAWMCLSSIAARAVNDDQSCLTSTSEILKQWLGEPNLPYDTLQVDTCVNLLYGPGAWELYGADVGSVGEVPGHMYLQGLTAKGPVSLASRVDSEVPVELPTTF